MQSSNSTVKATGKIAIPRLYPRLKVLFPQVTDIALLVVRDWVLLNNGGFLAIISWIPEFGGRQTSPAMQPIMRNIKGYIVYFAPSGQPDYVIITPYSYTPVSVATTLPTSGNIQFTVSGEEKVSVDIKDAYILPWFDGTNITMFKFMGETFFATSSRLDARAGKFGSDKTFYDMYLELGGVALDQLYPEDMVTSSEAWTFILHHPDVAKNTKTDQYYGLYLLQVQYLTNQPNLPSADWLKIRPNMTLTQANFFLQNGEIVMDENVAVSFGSEDDRLAPGEALVIYNPATNTQLKVISRGYAWREAVRDNASNLTVTLTRLYSVLVIPTETYVKTWPVLVGQDVTTPWGRYLNSVACLYYTTADSKHPLIHEAMTNLWGLSDSYDIVPDGDNYGISETGSKIKGQLPASISFLVTVIDNFVTGYAIPAEVGNVTRTIINRAQFSAKTSAETKAYLNNLIYNPTETNALTADQIIALISDFKKYRRAQYNKNKNNISNNPAPKPELETDYNNQFPVLA